MQEPDNFQFIIAEFADSEGETIEAELTVGRKALLGDLKRMDKVTIKWINEKDQAEERVFDRNSDDWSTFFTELENRQQNYNVDIFTSSHSNQVWFGAFARMSHGFMDFWCPLLGKESGTFRLDFNIEVEFCFEHSGTLRISVLSNPHIIRMHKGKKAEILDIGAAQYEIYFDPGKNKFIFDLNRFKVYRDPYKIFAAYLPVTWTNTEIFLTILSIFTLLGGGVASITLMALMLNPASLVGALGAVLFYGGYVLSGLSIFSSAVIGIRQFYKHKDRYKYLFNDPKPWKAIETDFKAKIKHTDSPDSEAAQSPRKNSIFSRNGSSENDLNESNCCFPEVNCSCLSCS